MKQKRRSLGAEIIELRSVERKPVRTCLVVDDSAITRDVARGILEQMGFLVLEATDGDKALAICRCLLPEAILLDWNMPVKDGYAFLGKLLRLRGGNQPRVVFYTTEGDVAQKARVPSVGTCGDNSKPFDRDAVAARFREAGLLTFTALPGSPAVDMLDTRDGM